MERESAVPNPFGLSVQKDNLTTLALPTGESTTASSTTATVPSEEITDANFAPVMYFALRDNVSSCLPSANHHHNNSTSDSDQQLQQQEQQQRLPAFAMPEDILLLICGHFSTIARLRLLSLVSRAFYNAVTNSFSHSLDVANLRNRWCRMLALRLPHVPRNVTLYNNLKCKVGRHARKLEPSLQFLAVLAGKSMGCERVREYCYESDDADHRDPPKKAKQAKQAEKEAANAKLSEQQQQQALEEQQKLANGESTVSVDEDAAKNQNPNQQNTLAKLSAAPNPNLRYRTIESLAINAAIDTGFGLYVTCSLVSLTSLTLYNTKLSQSRFNGMSTLTNLVKFRLVSSSKIVTYAPTLVQLTQLRELALYNTLVDNGGVERCMAELPLLETLALSVNHRLTGPTLQFSNIRNLTYEFPAAPWQHHFGHDKRLLGLAAYDKLLTLELDLLSDTDFLPNLTNLTSLSLFNCSVTTLPWNFQSLQTYIVKRPANLDANLLQGKLMPRLRFLDVERARATGEDLHTCLSLYENLTSLGLNRHLEMTSDCLTNLPAAKCITELYLNYCDRLTDISFLLQFPSLTILQLRSCVRITSLEPLQHMTQLTYLVLASVARVSIEWPYLTGLSRLQYLDIRLPKRGKNIVFTPENPATESELDNVEDGARENDELTTASSSTNANLNEGERSAAVANESTVEPAINSGVDGQNEIEHVPIEYNFYYPPEFSHFTGLTWVGILKAMLPFTIVNCGATASTTS